MSLLEIVAFKVYDIDRDGFISNGELYLVLKQMVGSNLKVSVLVYHIISKAGVELNPLILLDTGPAITTDRRQDYHGG